MSYIISDHVKITAGEPVDASREKKNIRTQKKIHEAVLKESE